MQVFFEPVFAVSPAQVEPAEVDLLGAVFLLTTTGILVAHEGKALELRLSPEQLLAVGTVMARLGHFLGANDLAALAMLREAPDWQGVLHANPAD